VKEAELVADYEGFAWIRRMLWLGFLSW
jgi:hypothetical protein